MVVSPSGCRSNARPMPAGRVGKPAGAFLRAGGGKAGPLPKPWVGSSTKVKTPPWWVHGGYGFFLQEVVRRARRKKYLISLAIFL
jgi:hypothetical protein